MAVMDELNTKYGPLPLWMWGLLTTGGGSWYLIHRKNKLASQNAESTQAAADQTNTNLGSASQLANLFEVAGLMPYQGGDTFINITEPPDTTGSQAPGSTGTPTPVHGRPPAGPHPPIPVHGPQPPKQTTGSSPTTSPQIYTVKKGDNLTTIARRFGVFGGSGNALYNYQLQPGVRSAESQDTLRRRGPNKIFAGESIYIPSK